MDYVKPVDVVGQMLESSARKLSLSPKVLLISGMFSGALLGFATSLALGAAVSTGQALVGALIFPVGFVIIVLLGLELVTGSFGLLPLSLLERRTSPGKILANWSLVFVGNLIGSVIYGALLAIVLTNMGSSDPGAVGARIIAVAQAKTAANEALGFAGLVSVFVKAILCNWMVCMGVVVALTSSSTVGKIAAAWLPIVIFFAQGFEHSVVNMFVIPTGMMLGAKVSFAQWWLWNQIPVTLGNIVGGFVFATLGLYLMHRRQSAAAAKTAGAAAAPVAAE